MPGREDKGRKWLYKGVDPRGKRKGNKRRREERKTVERNEWREEGEKKNRREIKVNSANYI